MSRNSPHLEIAVPTELNRARAELLDVLATRPAEIHAEIVRVLSSRLWRRWRPALAPLGFTAGDLRNVLSGYEREAWLWVVGDRSFVAMIEGLIGRIERRITR